MKNCARTQRSRQKIKSLKSTKKLQAIEGSNHLIQTFLSSVQHTDLPDVKLLEVLILLTWFINRFWKTFCHIFSATQALEKTKTNWSQKALQYVYCLEFFSECLVLFGTLFEALRNYHGKSNKIYALFIPRSQ